MMESLCDLLQFIHRINKRRVGTLTYYGKLSPTVSKNNGTRAGVL